MDKFLTVDEIIDKHAYDISIYKHIRAHDPAFLNDFERFAVSISGKNPAIWWTEMSEKVMTGTVYVFNSRKKFERFKKSNYSFINKINFIL